MKFGYLAALTAFTLLGSDIGRAQTNELWCTTDEEGEMNCIYQSLPACEAVIRSEGGICVPNPDV